MLSEFEAVYIIQQLLQAIEYLHSQGLVHRDLKLSNVLISTINKIQYSFENNFEMELVSVKLCDFGLAVQLQHPDEEHFTLCGTPQYIAPEIASQQPHGAAADIWSIGVLFYFLVIGNPPFDPQDIEKWLIVNHIDRMKAVQKIFDSVEEKVQANVLSLEAKEFLQQILQSVSFIDHLITIHHFLFIFFNLFINILFVFTRL
jgi:serine/threonine protein kinase